MSNTEKLVIKTLNKPSKETPDELWEWFCDVFGLAGKGDELEPVMLREIAEGSFSGYGVTSKDLNKRLDMPRSTVIYHLNRFIYSGFVIRKGRRYYLRSEDMTGTLQELQSDMLREFNRLMEFAGRLDRMLESEVNVRREKGRKQERE